MKKHTLFWLALSWLLTVNVCAGTTYKGDANYNEQQVTVIVTNHLEQTLAARLKEEPGMTAQVLEPGASYTWKIRRQRKITVIGEIYEERGWSSERVLAKIDRNALLDNIIEIPILDGTMQNEFLQPGYITNYMPWAASFREVRNVEIGILAPNKPSRKLLFPPGQISLIGTFIEGPYAGHEFTDNLIIDNDPKDANWFDGQYWRKTGWTFPVDENRKSNDWRKRRH